VQLFKVRFALRWFDNDVRNSLMFSLEIDRSVDIFDRSYLASASIRWLWLPPEYTPRNVEEYSDYDH
jgi:hypothetical protein